MAIEKWRCYSVERYPGHPPIYMTKSVEASDLASAQNQYSIYGVYEFIWAEPLAESQSWFAKHGGFGFIPRSADIVERLKAAGFLFAPETLRDYETIQPGPRKPVPAVPVEVHSNKEFDANAAWDATRALCRGS